MARRKGKSQRRTFDEILEEDIAKDVEDPKAIEEDTLTIACSFCEEGLYSIRGTRLVEAREVREKPIVREDLETLHAMVDDTKTQILMDCPICGGDVFFKHYYGGFTAFTLERGRFPNEPRTPGFRIRDFRWGDPNGTLEQVRERLAKRRDFALPTG